MRMLTIAGLGIAMAALGGTAAVAQYAQQYAPGQYAPDPSDSPAYNNGAYPSGQPQYAPPPPQYNSNVQSAQDYQNAMSAYESARDTAAQQNENYQRNSNNYRANQDAYHRRLREYYRARAAYDAEYGAGAYEAYYGPPPAPWW